MRPFLRAAGVVVAVASFAAAGQPLDGGAAVDSDASMAPDAGVATSQAPLDVAGSEGGAPGHATEDGASAASAEDLAAIEAALGADAAAGERDGPGGPTTTPPPPPPPPPSPLARAIQSMNPDLSFIADIAFAWFSSRDPLQTGGHDPTQRGFNLQQLELAIGSAVDPYFRFDANIVFSPFAVEIEEVYATTLALPYGLQARVGQFLTRFGRMNNTHPHSWFFVDQPFALGRVFSSENNRGLGVEASWLSPLPWYLEVVGSVTDANGARTFLGGSGLPTEHPLDFQFTGAVKQFFDLSDTVSLLFGLSAANGPNPEGRQNRSDVYGVDLYVKYRPLSSADPTQLAFQTEWFYRRRQVPEDVLADVNGYLQALWRFEQRWGVAARYEFGSPAWGLDGEPEEELLDPDWTRPRHRISANVTFWPTEFSRIRLQGAYDLPLWRDAADLSVFLAFEFLVGAHGAHTF